MERQSLRRHACSRIAHADRLRQGYGASAEASRKGGSMRSTFGRGPRTLKHALYEKPVGWKDPL
jgi:hypothetical protein